MGHVATCSGKEVRIGDVLELDGTKDGNRSWLGKGPVTVAVLGARDFGVRRGKDARLGSVEIWLPVDSKAIVSHIPAN